MIATLANDQLNHVQLAEFLRSKCPSDPHEEPKVPVFYGIPKIHKIPTKFRPIIPCHSCAQAPAGKYVSKVLKNLIAETRFCIKGSKDLATRFSKLKLSGLQKYWIVSGDIVAFYPNVPLAECLNIITNKVTQSGLQEGASLHLFISCMQAACRELLLDFQGESYIQLNGLAMGVACSPDMANLYAAHYEEKSFDDGVAENRPGMPVFYGRYIDDMLAIVPANSADQALQYAKSWIQVGDVEIECVFRPVCFTRVHHKPYAKARNHKERIPWASHHPKDVKKGTYIGEMSRLAVLSSKPEHYSDAIEQLKQLYIGRGYPLDLKLTNVNNVAETPFVIKSHFSPSWSLFDVHKLGQSVVNSWLGSMASYRDAASKWNELTADARFLDLRTAVNPAARSFSEAGHLGPPATAESVPDRAGLSFTGGLAQVGHSNSQELERVVDIGTIGFHNKKWLVSRRRNYNLGDFASMWKKTVLNTRSFDDELNEVELDDWA
ncbi:hypothetical protein A0H81_14966 [Grifola frondosa]|uniref:Helix-turn-helix domain-containing protein n=1 Tax=Grifola frondosa TaxID=5627 RepID=A0A1C7LK38_GRIFR|nr:hypothetical protein A0H81_14966 [Grifola frondosa]